MNITVGSHEISLTIEELANALARTNNEDQAAFFNEFNKQLQASCEGSILGYGCQLLRILEGLDMDTETMFAHLHREIENKLT